MTPAQRITQHYRGDWSGNQGAFPTPGHSAKDRGVTIKDAANGDVVFHCHNDSAFDWRAMKDECREAGLLDPLEPQHEMTANDRGTWRETGTYEYRNPDGSIAYRTVRKEKAGERKRFVAQRPDGRGGWETGLGDAARVLYRLPELLAADPLEPVYLVEGERKADKLAGSGWGLVATAVAFGAKGWKGFYAAPLADRTVIILPDNDDEGRAFAERASQDIIEAGGRVAVIALPGLPLKGDIIDWAAGGRSAFELRQLTDAALNEPAQTFDLADLGLWARVPPTPKVFAMAPYLPQEDVITITGDGGTNKSTFALQISACAAAGRKMLGMDVIEVPALYVTAEDDNRENHWRLSKIAQAIGTSIGRLQGRLHIVSLRGRLNNELATFDHDGKLKTAPAFGLLRATIIATGAKIVTLDNVAHLFAGNENDRSQVTAFINLLYSLCNELGVTILLIAHRNKAGDTYSGSTAWLNAVRSQITMARVEGDADARSLTLGKANYARQGEDMRFRWHDFALVRDEDLSPSLMAEISATAAASGENQAFLDCLRERARQGDGRHVGPSPGPNYAPSQFQDMPQARGIDSRRLKAAMDRLFSIGAIETFTFENKAKGREVTVIREVPGSPRTPFPNRSRTVPEAAPEPLPNGARTTPRTHSYINIPGAASEAAAPSQGNGKAVDQSRGQSGLILAPGESDDDDVPGWPS